MDRPWDTVTIGSGLPCLLAGALLAKRGKRVLVLDEGPEPNDATEILTVDEYRFPRGPDLFLGFERDGPFERTFTELGIAIPQMRKETGASVKTESPLQIVLQNHRLDWHTHSPSMELEMAREFPEEAAEIRAFLIQVTSIENILYSSLQLATTRSPVRPADRIQILRDWWRVFRTRHATARKSALTRPDHAGLGAELRRALELLFILFFNRRSSDGTDLELVLLLGLLLREVVAIQGGISRLRGFLVKTLHEHQGQMLSVRSIQELVVKQRRVTAVRTALGDFPVVGSILASVPEPVLPTKWSPLVTLDLYYKVSARAIPIMMRDHVLYSPDSRRQPLGDNFIYLSAKDPQDGPAAPKGMKGLRVTTVLEPGQESNERTALDLSKPIRDHLVSLMPFSEQSLSYLGAATSAKHRAECPIAVTEYLAKARFSKAGEECYSTVLRNLFLVADPSSRPVAGLNALKAARQFADLGGR